MRHVKPRNQDRHVAFRVLLAIAAALALVAVVLGLLTFCRAPQASQADGVETSDQNDAPGTAKADDASGDEAPQDGSTGSEEPVDGSDALAAKVQAAVSPIVDATNAEMSVAFVPLDEGMQPCYISADTQMRSASLIKLVILAQYLNEVDAGSLSPEEGYRLRSSDIVGGTGSLQGKGAGYEVTMDRLAELMISQSDNVAANILIDRLGMDAINGEASSLGLASTTLERKMMDSAAMAAGKDNYTSAKDVSSILALIGRGRLVSPSCSEKALGWLEEQQDRSGIPAGLPSDVTVGNKTGSLDSERHDAAIVLADQRPYVLVVMTAGLGGTEADEVIARISSAVWQAVSAG